MIEKLNEIIKRITARLAGEVFIIADIIAAITLLTRIPVPASLRGDGDPDAETNTARSYWAFALVGVLVAILPAIAGAALVAAGAPTFAAAAVVMAGIALLTGGIHQDGLADLADSFGGDSRSRRLEIMRDSSIGSFGVLALIIVNIISIAALAALGDISGRAMFGGAVAAAALSRGMMAVQRFLHEPPDATGLAYSTGKPEMIAVIIAVASGMLVAMLLTGTTAAIAALVIGGAATLGLGLWCRNHIGGVNGDGLGASQQISEAVMLVVMAHALA